MDNHSQHRVSKRSTYACSRCRRQKLKCSGLQPCDRCTQRRQTCVFDERDNKIMVTRGYLSDLLQRISQLEDSQEAIASQAIVRHSKDGYGNRGYGNQDATNHAYFDPFHVSGNTLNGELRGSPPEDTPELDDSSVVNPLIATPSRYLSASNGKPFYLGTSSTWSFSRRVLTVTHEQIRQCPLPVESLLFDGCAYDLDLSDRGSHGFEKTSIPSYDYAVYLVNTVKFRCCQLLHFFEEDEFMANMAHFYSKFEAGDFDESGSWYVQYLLVLAFGKGIVQRRSDASRPAGTHFFVRAVRLMPSVIALDREPLMSSEILCGMSWYYQALDFRHASHNLIGQAKSVAMNHGMHTDMSVADLGEKAVLRCRKIWWTVYVLDRQMTCLMGLPQPWRDEGISCLLPTYPGSSQRTAASAMQIKLAQIIADISTTLYDANGQLNRSFVVRTRSVLEGIASVAEELSTAFPLHAGDKDRFSGVSRLVAQLHLLYYQCIVLATRPLLLSCLMKKFDAPAEADRLVASPKVRNLMQMCVESSQQILNILDSLRTQDLLETFVPLDLEPLFAATVVLFLAWAVDSQLMDTEPQWLSRSFVIYDEMIKDGNRIAAFRKKEIQRLKELMDDFTPNNGTQTHELGPQPSNQLDQTSPPTPSFQNTIQSILVDPPPEFAPSLYSGVDPDGQVDEVTAEQIMAAASSMEWDDIEWAFTVHHD